ncbi:MAG: FtsW/RodA/SpoVE family cell cycle protein [Actinomycetota bacterium]
MRPLLGSDRRRLVHWPLAATAMALGCLGIVMVHSAGRRLTDDGAVGARQALFVGLGSLLLLAGAGVDHRRLRRYVPIVVAVAVAGLVLVLTPLGTEVRGTQGWFRFGGVALQPSEPAKLGLVLGLAAVLDRAWGPDGRPARAGLPDGPIDRHPDRRPGPARFAAGLVLLGLCSALVLAQGETGTVLVFGAIAVGMFATAGVAVRYIALLVVTGVAVVGLALDAGVLSAYQVDRFEVFLRPDHDPLGAGYNQRQALAAIGSGGLAGAGLFAGPQTQLGYVPDQHTDFIFAAVAEELGLLGAGLLIGLQALLLTLVWSIGRDCRDEWGRLLCAGVFALLASQVIQNLAMNLRLAPITGIALPFVSYGGSAMLTSMAAVGLVQSVALHHGRRR